MSDVRYRIGATVLMTIIACATGPASQAAATVGARVPDAGTSNMPPASSDAGLRPDTTACAADAGSGPSVGAPAQISPLSPNDDSIPSLLISPFGHVELATHRMIVTACLICDAERLVQDWDGSGWTTTLDEGGRPGSGTQPTALVWDHARNAPLLADSDLSDPYHPPLSIHVWVLTPSGKEELGSSPGTVAPESHLALRAGSHGTPTLAWTDASGAVRVASFTSGAWQQLPGVANTANALDLQLDASESPLLAWCGGGALNVSRWDPASGAWNTIPALPGSCNSVSMAVDGDALLIAHSFVNWEAPRSEVAVDRWDGTRWTNLGQSLGDGPQWLLVTTKGLMLSTAAGIWQRTDRLTLVDCASATERPYTLAPGEDFVLSVWKRSATTEQPAALFFRKTAQ